jgi:hypothetical protein
MTTPTMHDALNAIFIDREHRLERRRQEPLPQATRDAIQSAILTAVNGAASLEQLTQHLEAVEHAAWSARMTVQRLIDGI